jgi:hypothetical protein
MQALVQMAEILFFLPLLLTAVVLVFLGTMEILEDLVEAAEEILVM